MYSRELLKGTLSVIILKLLSEHTRMYGYEIFKLVKEQSDEKIVIKDGSLYPALQKMNRDGLISFEEVYIGKRVRKYYYLTPEGEKAKTYHIKELKDFMKTLDKIIFNQLSPL
jgi:PadR family transcriptional regulator PadR